VIDVDPKDAGRIARGLEPLHGMVYFVPETEQHLTAAGLKPGRMSYFAGRAAPMGAVGAGVVTATFYNFSPSLVAHMIPRAWTMASPEQVVEARPGRGRARHDGHPAERRRQQKLLDIRLHQVKPVVVDQVAFGQRDHAIGDPV